MTTETEPLKIPWIPTRWIPTEYFFACIDDPEDAARTAKSLRSARFRTHDVHVLSGKEFTNTMEEQCEHCDILMRVFRFTWKWGTEAGLTFMDFADEAKAGHTIVGIHLLKLGVEEVRQILDEHLAHRIEDWGYLSPARTPHGDAHPRHMAERISPIQGRRASGTPSALRAQLGPPKTRTRQRGLAYQ